MKPTVQLVCDIVTIIIAIITWIITDTTDVAKFQKFVTYILMLNFCALMRIAMTLGRGRKDEK